MFKNVIFWSVFSITFSLYLYAEEKPNFTFSSADLNKHLSQNTIRQIYQDSTGYLWVVTQEGLSRYDGYQLLSFTSDPRKPNSLSSDNVRAVLEDHKKRLWVATDGGGLNLFNSANQTFTVWQEGDNSPAKPTSSRQVSLYLDSQNFIWLGYRNGSFSRFNPDSKVFEHFNTRKLLPALDKDAAVTSFAEDANAIWLATDGNGLLKLDKTSQQLTRFYKGSNTALFSDRLLQVFIDAQQRLWLTSYDAGVSVADPQRANFTNWQHHENQTDSLAANLVHTIYQDQKQRIWLGTEEGASLWNGRDAFLNFSSSDGLADDKILSILQDTTGLMWFGTFHGLTNSIEVAFDNLDEGLAHSMILGFAETESSDGESSIWVASYGGLTQLDSSGEVQRVINKDSQPALPDSRVMTVSGKHNLLWFGTRGAGLGRLNVDNDQIDFFTHDPENPTSLSSNGVPSIFPDPLGNIWVGTYGGGVNYLAAGSDEFVHYRHDENNPRSLNNDRVLAVYQLVDGTIVVGTVSGINLLDPVSLEFDNIEHQPDNVDSLSASMAWAFYQDPMGSLWVGTQGGGLNQWHPQDMAALNNYFTHYNSFSGLPSSHIYAILDDDKGYLWLSSTAGLTRLEPKTDAVRNFDTSDGLKNSEFNFGAGFKDSRGMMYFGGNSGLVRFHPDDIKDSQFIPPVVLVRIKKLNEQVWFDVPYQKLQELVLEQTDYFVSFEFAALDFRAPEQNEYRYKLEGLDPNWIELGHSRLATFTNLPAGDYVLKVQASNNQGMWNTQGINLPIRMLPPHWRTWWAYSFYTFVVMLLVMNVIWRYRQRRLLAIDRLIELEDKVKERTTELRQANEQLGLSMQDTQKARELAEQASKEKSDFLAIMSHEIRTPMNGVLGMTEVLLSSSLQPKQQHIAQIVYRSGRLLLDLLNNILDFSKLEAGKATLESVPVDLEALLEDVCDLFGEAAYNKGLNINPILSPETLPLVYGDPAKLRQIIANLTSNAIKFTEQGEVNLSIKRMPCYNFQVNNTGSSNQYSGFVFCVQDSGIGMAADRQQKVFEMFTQADASTTRKYGGTGLGLAICKQLTALMGGKLAVQTDVGQGSRFILELDLALSAQPPVPLTTIDDCPIVHLVNLEGGLGYSITTMLDKLRIKWLHVKRIESEPAGAKHGIWISLSEYESSAREAGIPQESWICLQATSQWQEHDNRNILTLPVHFSGLQKCLNVALCIENDQQPYVDAYYRNLQKFNANILVAEDSMTNQEVAKSMLELLGCEVWLANNGAEAVEHVNVQKPDLVLMDCQMPIMDGYAATKAIRENWPDIPIVALTAGMGDDLRQQCLEVGINEVMSKPFSLQDLEYILNRFLSVAHPGHKARSITVKDTQQESRYVSLDSLLDNQSEIVLLDMATVNTLLRISSDTSNPVFCRVLDAFTQEAEKLIAQINEQVSRENLDLSMIADIAHALKSMSGNVGAKALFELCGSLEDKLINNQRSEITALTQNISAICDVSCKKLETFRNVI
jgi:signal transduction histidine kinase/ligand-binding sensor domain-containing protein/DNA-binding response OmpR family regulator/HPt (histidine-containing phosphotransfer) domain-containing protein